MQSIIVYRNPLEAAMWEGIMGGNFFPVIVGVIVFFAVFLAANRFIVERYWGWNSRDVPTYVALAIGAVIGIATIFFMA
jgi:hypothetical protein